MPARWLREGILTSDKVDRLTFEEEVFYRRLLSVVDDHGLFDARPVILLARLYPLRIGSVTAEQCAAWAAACERAGLICLYESGGKPFLKLLNTQWPERSAPKYPTPTQGQLEQSAGKVLAVANSCSQPPASAVVLRSSYIEDRSSVSTSLRSVDTPAAGAAARDEIWRIGLELLASQGLGNKSGRAYLGMLVKNHGEEQVLTSLQQAARERPVDVRGWLLGVLRPKPESRTATRARVGAEIFGGEDGNRDETSERDVTANSQRIA